ncbi:hypothetical protein Tco_0028568, partial [Tanacetum coccineum]
KVLLQMLELKLESEKDSTMALKLIRFVKKLIAELEEGSLSVGFKTTQQMVINSPCLTNIKNWLVQKQTTFALAIPEKTTTGKEISNPFMAGSLPKTT